MRTNITALAILIGFGLVAASLYITGMQSQDGTYFVENETSIVRTEARYVYGDPDAPTVIVEFSDFQCPFCAKHHPTLKRIVDESDGQIAWEYRHFPLPSHPLADDAAYGAECVGKHLGNEAFWKYTDSMFSTKVTEKSIKDTAIALGLSEKKFDTCIADEKTQAIVSADEKAVTALGLNSTPSNVVVFSDGMVEIVAGALPYDQLLSVLKR